jgi:hypothetical protein
VWLSEAPPGYKIEEVLVDEELSISFCARIPIRCTEMLLVLAVTETCDAPPAEAAGLCRMQGDVDLSSQRLRTVLQWQ